LFEDGRRIEGYGIRRAMGCVVQGLVKAGMFGVLEFRGGSKELCGWRDERGWETLWVMKSFFCGAEFVYIYGGRTPLAA